QRIIVRAIACGRAGHYNPYRQSDSREWRSRLMQNRTATPMDDAQMAYYAAQHAPIAWTPDQLVRLEHEWRQLQRNFAYHPSVRIIPLNGNPPAEYTVEFKARTLYIREDG